MHSSPVLRYTFELPISHCGWDDPPPVLSQGIGLSLVKTLESHFQTASIGLLRLGYFLLEALEGFCYCSLIAL
jgi:hypothetical protein